jgi:hypothetical protein
LIIHDIAYTNIVLMFSCGFCTSESLAVPEANVNK